MEETRRAAAAVSLRTVQRLDDMLIGVVSSLPLLAVDSCVGVLCSPFVGAAMIPVGDELVPLTVFMLDFKWRVRV